MSVLIGCHVSISGGIERSPQRAADTGCDSFQIFTANQMQWKAAPISTNSRDNFLSEMENFNFQQVVAHDSYLINLGSPDSAKLTMSRTAFIEEINRCTFLKIPYIVFHPGSHMGKSVDFALKTIAESIDFCLEAVPESTVTLLQENTAGQGTNVGYRFEHLEQIIRTSRYPNRLGVCLDTCHAFAAGYDFTSETAYNNMFSEFDNIIGLERLKVFHLNDSKKELGSRVDRHHQLGQGLISIDPFYRLVNDDRFHDCPMILETPGEDAHYAREIRLLKESVKS